MIPIFLDDIGSTELRKSLLKELPLLEVQSRLDFDLNANDQQRVDFINERISRATTLAAQNDFNTRYIATDVFSQLSPAILQQESEQMDIAIDSWLPDDNLKLKVALKLIGFGLAPQARRCIKELKNHLASESDVIKVKINDLLGIIAASWVDSASIHTITHQWKGKSFVLNNDNAILPLLYLFNIKPPKSVWYLVQVNFVMDINAVENLIDNIWQNLKEWWHEEDEAELNDILEENFDDGRPVCVSIAIEILDTDIVDKIRDEFPHVLFFLVVQQLPLDQTRRLNDQLVFLEPYLDKSEELKLLVNYNKYQQSLLREV
jgi:hypothetical protein